MFGLPFGPNAGSSAWQMALQPASWRGHIFYTDTTSTTAGRLTVTHVYPNKKSPYVEDLGEAPHEVSIRGWINSEFGLVYQTSKDLQKQINTLTGPGELVHPAYGSERAVLTSARFSEDKSRGGIVSVEFRFILTPEVKKPKKKGTKNALKHSSKHSKSTIGALFHKAMGAVHDVEKEAGKIISTAEKYYGEVQGVVGDAENALGSVVGLDNMLGDNTIGRFLNGPLNTVNSAFSMVQRGVSDAVTLQAGVQAGINTVTQARSIATSAASGLESLVKQL